MRHPYQQVLLTYPTRFTEGIFLDEALTRFDEVGWTEELEDAMFASRLTLSE